MSTGITETFPTVPVDQTPVPLANRAGPPTIKPPTRASRRSHSLSETDNPNPRRRPLHTPNLPSTIASPTFPTQLESVLEVATPISPGPSVPMTASAISEALIPIALPNINPNAVPRNERPKPKKPPRRAFSLMDSEPVVHTHKPCENWTLFDLPVEIIFAIFDCLDPIDSACFGLTCRSFYPVHMRLCGKVSLGTRRNGPNTYEWAWRNGGCTRFRNTPPSSPGGGHLESPLETALTPTTAPAATAATTTTTTTTTVTTLASGATTTTTTVTTTTTTPAPPVDLRAIRRDGQVYCRKCGVDRCELHRHLRQWFGPAFEYCHVTRKYGKKAPETAPQRCYKRSPKNPMICGRHAPPKAKHSTPTSPDVKAAE